MKENWQQDTQEGICGWSKRLYEDILKAALWINTSNESLPLSQLNTSKTFHPYASSLQAQPIYWHTHLQPSELVILKWTLAKWLHTLTFKLLLFDFRTQVPIEKNLMIEACEILFDYPQIQEEKVALNYIFKVVSQL